MISAGVVEGSGPFICTNESHTEQFKTNNLTEFNEHLKGKGHTVSGRMPCAICEKEVTFDNLSIGKKAVCEECKTELSA